MKQKEFFLIALTVFLTIVVWIIADINHIMITSQVIDKGDREILQTKVNINESVFDLLENKK